MVRVCDADGKDELTSIVCTLIEGSIKSVWTAFDMKMWWNMMKLYILYDIYSIIYVNIYIYNIVVYWFCTCRPESKENPFRTLCKAWIRGSDDGEVKRRERPCIKAGSKFVHEAAWTFHWYWWVEPTYFHIFIVWDLTIPTCKSEKKIVCGWSLRLLEFNVVEWHCWPSLAYLVFWSIEFPYFALGKLKDLAMQFTST